MRKLLRIFLLAAIFLTSCTSGEIKPVAIESSDMCSFCKMAISEKQFAAEIITTDEKVLKFDDLRCLLKYRQANQIKPAAIFVTDYDSHEWLKAENAFFAKSKTVKTPMGGGILAYSDKTKVGSESMKFDDLKP
jgi:copper chaperone NosL